MSISSYNHDCSYYNSKDETCNHRDNWVLRCHKHWCPLKETQLCSNCGMEFTKGDGYPGDGFECCCSADCWNELSGPDEYETKNLKRCSNCGKEFIQDGDYPNDEEYCCSADCLYQLELAAVRAKIVCIDLHNSK